METEPHIAEARHAPQLASTWVLGAGSAALCALGMAVLALQLDEPIAAAGAAVVVATILLAGLRQLHRWAPPLGAIAVIVIFVVAERFDDETRMAVLLAAVAFSTGVLSARLARSRTRLQAEVDDLHRRAELRSIRNAVNDVLAQRGRSNYLAREFVRAQRYGREMTIAVAEVDNLELLRRERGPEAVRDVLVQLGDLFSADTRLPDGGISEDLRLLFVLPETPLLGGRTVCERVRLGFHQLGIAGADGVPLTVSIGVASYPADGPSGDEVVTAAEAALARATERGGNRTTLSTSIAGSPAGWSK